MRLALASLFVVFLSVLHGLISSQIPKRESGRIPKKRKEERCSEHHRSGSTKRLTFKAKTPTKFLSDVRRHRARPAQTYLVRLPGNAVEAN